MIRMPTLQASTAKPALSSPLPTARATALSGKTLSRTAVAADALRAAISDQALIRHQYQRSSRTSPIPAESSMTSCQPILTLPRT